MTQDIAIVAMTEADLAQASETVRLAFATFIGATDPAEFWNDRDYVRSRWYAPHTAWFKALCAGQLVGVACVTRWGSSGIVGPIAVQPAYWDRKVAKGLMGAAVAQLDQWGVTHAGLFTFSNSPKHLGLYQHFGFWPQTLNAVMARPVQDLPLTAEAWRYAPSSSDRPALKAACAALTDAIEPGLDVSGEIDAVFDQKLGATLILPNAEGQPQAFAICHFGPHSEAGKDVCYIKFAAVAPGADTTTLAQLIAACDALAVAEGQKVLMAGVNTGRRAAYRWMIEAGFRTEILGITMHRKGKGYDREDVMVLDDWR